MYLEITSTSYHFINILNRPLYLDLFHINYVKKQTSYDKNIAKRQPRFTIKEKNL